MALKDAQEKLLALVKEGETLAQKGELTPNDLRRLEEINAEADPLKAEIKALQGSAGLSAWAKESAGALSLANAGNGNAASVTGIRQDGAVVIEERKDSILVAADGTYLLPDEKVKAIREPGYKAAMRAYIRAIGNERMLKDADLKALQEGLDVSGGYLVPEDIQNRVLQKEPTPLVLAGRVTRLTTARDAIAFPKVTYTTDNNYTTPMRVNWTGEIPASATTHRVTDPTFGQARIPIYTAMLSLPVTNDMVEDTGFDILAWAADKFRETIDLLYEDMIVEGTGVGQPRGITVASGITTVNSGAAANVTGDGIVDLAFNLPPQYDPEAVFVMNKTVTAREIFQLKDGNGRYLWSNAQENGGLTVPKVRSDLLGFPVLYSEFMPNATTASNKAIIFGDLRGYYLVQRIGFSISVLRELYAETNQVLILGRVRFGGDVVEDWRLRLQNISA